MTSRQELEQRLLTNPFDADAREVYAQLLLEDGSADEAKQQFELLCQQQPQSAAAHVGAARALLALGQEAPALERYNRARRCERFTADEALEKLDQQSIRASGPPKLHVVEREIDGNVVSLHKADVGAVRFSDIVGAEELKRTIRLKIIEPFVNPGLFQRFRKQAGGGILLYGPPGCGKTMLARAVATECKAEFISVGIADVLNMWIGESERNLASLFERARAYAPCVLFFDEIDALAYSRSKAQSEHTRTVVNEFLAQLDGMGANNCDVLMLAATNMPWDVDPAMRRPGRFTRQIFVPPPDAEGRHQMLLKKLEGVPQEALDLGALAEKCAHFSGADIDGLIELAKEHALHDALINNNERPLQQFDLEAALTDLNPTTMDWLRTARNLVKYAGDDRFYADVAVYLKKTKLV